MKSRKKQSNILKKYRWPATAMEKVNLVVVDVVASEAVEVIYEAKI
jgi:hypothetical protein